MMIKSLTGAGLFGMASHAEGDAIPFVAAGEVYEVRFRFLSRFLHRTLDAFMFKVEARETDRRKDGYFDLAIEPACLYERKA